MTTTDELRAVVTRHAGEHGFAGVCLVKRGDEALLHEAYGLAHRGFGIPNQLDTRFDIASVTKTFTAAAIMQLVEQGEFALDTRVMPFLGITGTRISDDVTVFHCLTHTSGIGDDADEEAGEDYEAALHRQAQLLAPRNARLPAPVRAQGTRTSRPARACATTTSPSCCSGLVIEQATGLSYRDYVRQHVFERAGMTGADFCAMDGVCAELRRALQADRPRGRSRSNGARTSTRIRRSARRTAARPSPRSISIASCARSANALMGEAASRPAPPASRRAAREIEDRQ